MILVTQPNESMVSELRRILDRLGFACEVSMGTEQAVLTFSGDGDLKELEEALIAFPDVDVIPILSGREYWKTRSRRRFMAGVSAGLGVLTAAGVGVPLVGFLMPPKGTLRAPRMVRAARAGEVAENSAVTVRFQGSPVLLVRHEGGQYFALSAVCTHMDICQLDWDPDRRQLVCPCHGGAFDVHGNVVQGPPSVPLPTFEVEQDGEEILIKRRG